MSEKEKIEIREMIKTISENITQRIVRDNVGLRGKYQNIYKFAVITILVRLVSGKTSIEELKSANNELMERLIQEEILGTDFSNISDILENLTDIYNKSNPNSRENTPIPTINDILNSSSSDTDMDLDNNQFTPILTSEDVELLKKIGGRRRKRKTRRRRKTKRKKRKKKGSGNEQPQGKLTHPQLTRPRVTTRRRRPGSRTHEEPTEPRPDSGGRKRKRKRKRTRRRKTKRKTKRKTRKRRRR